MLAGRVAMMSFSIPASVEGDGSLVTGVELQLASSGRPANASSAVAALILVIEKSLQCRGEKPGSPRRAARKPRAAPSLATQVAQVLMSHLGCDEASSDAEPRCHIIETIDRDPVIGAENR